jgi:hypothetical protein
MKESVILLLAALLAVLCSTVIPATAQAMPSPPPNPEAAWQPPDDGESVDPPVGVEVYSHPNTGTQVTLPSPAPYGASSSITTAYIINSYGQLVNTLYRGELCYLILSVNGPGYFYLWEYYPTGSPYGHWLCYKWYRPGAGVWKIGPFVAQSGDPEGYYTWKMWYLSGPYWSTRSLGFNYTRNYSPYSLPPVSPVPIPTPTPVPIPTPQPVYQPAAVNSFTASPATIEYGQSVTLTWTTSNATAVTISPGVGPVGVSGSTQVTPTSSTSYTLTATGRTGNPASSTVMVTVKSRVVPTLSSDRTSVQKGQPVTLSWNAPGAVQVSLSGAGSVSASGTRQVTPEDTTTYALTATYHDGTSQQATVTVNVEQVPLLLFVLVILLALAAVIIIALLVGRSKRSARSFTPDDKEAVTRDAAATAAGAAAATQQAETEPVTSPTTEVPAARLVMPDGSELLLAGSARSFGRRDLEKFLPPDKQTYISRQHFEITCEEGKYYIEDRASTNGTRVNDVEIRGTGRRTLEANDVIEIATKLKITFNQ